MNVTVEIPDDLVPRLTAGGRDLSRDGLEMIAVEAYKQDRITKLELQRLLGIQMSYQLDGFLKAHHIWHGGRRNSRTTQLGPPGPLMQTSFDTRKKGTRYEY